jgi:hypothetical protein
VFVRLNMCLSSMLALPVTSLPLSFFFFLSSYILVSFLTTFVVTFPPYITTVHPAPVKPSGGC